MEKLIRSMAKRVDTDEAVGYLVSCCIKDVAGDYQIIPHPPASYALCWRKM